MSFGNAARQPMTYECTALVGLNKAGTIKPLDGGYYRAVLGAFDFYNSGGAYYPFKDAQHLFEDSSALMRRIATGNCRGECGHPRKDGSMSMRDFVNRVCDIYEPNISHHIRRVTIDKESVKGPDGRPCIAVIGEVKPAGPRGPALQAAFENKHEDVCFSVRSLTKDDYVGSTLHKRMVQLITWDWVNEPGISVARKWNSPSLESMVITPTQIAQARALATRNGSGMESANVRMLDEMLSATEWNSKTILPPSARW